MRLTEPPAVTRALAFAALIRPNSQRLSTFDMDFVARQPRPLSTPPGAPLSLSHLRVPTLHVAGQHLI